MELNYNCLRETLIMLEKKLELTDDFEFKPLGIHEIASYSELTSKYESNKIAYCVYMLADSGLIKILPCGDWVRELQVLTLTYKGHEFLKQIANDTVWNKIMKVLQPIGAISISIISKTAEIIIKEFITSNL